MVQSSATTWITALGWGERVTDLNNPTLTFEEQPETVSKVNLFPVLSAPWHPRPSPGAPGLTWEEFASCRRSLLTKKSPATVPAAPGQHLPKVLPGCQEHRTKGPGHFCTVLPAPGQVSWAPLYCIFNIASTSPVSAGARGRSLQVAVALVTKRGSLLTKKKSPATVPAAPVSTTSAPVRRTCRSADC